MRVRVVGVAFLFPGRERANGSCDNFDAWHKIKDCLPAVSFPARVVVQKALYRFVGALVSEVRVVGVAFLFPGRERANGSCGNFDAFPSSRSAVPGDCTHFRV